MVYLLSFGSKCLHNLFKHQKSNDLNISDHICLSGLADRNIPPVDGL